MKLIATAVYKMQRFDGFSDFERFDYFDLLEGNFFTKIETLALDSLVCDFRKFVQRKL